jgi:hypothetical protein
MLEEAIFLNSSSYQIPEYWMEDLLTKKGSLHFGRRTFATTNIHLWAFIS